MSKRVEEKAMDAWAIYEYREHPQGLYHTCFIDGFLQGYEQAEEDLTNAAAFSSGPDGFYYGKGYQQGKKDAEKHLGWHSVDESLPPVDEEVIVLRDELDVAPYYEISFGHIVNQSITIDYNHWNVSGVKYWMPMPKIKEEKDDRR